MREDKQKFERWQKMSFSTCYRDKIFSNQCCYANVKASDFAAYSVHIQSVHQTDFVKLPMAI